MNKIIKNSKSGSAMIETIMEFIIIMMMLCMFMALWQPIMIYLNVNYYARNITTAIECAGNSNKTTVEGILNYLDDTINIGD